MKRVLMAAALLAAAGMFTSGLTAQADKGWTALTPQAKPSAADAAKQAKAEKAAAEKRQKEADAWVTATMKKMTLDEKVGQLIFSSINAAYLSADTEDYEKLLHLVRDLHVGGFHVFGTGEAMPAVLLNPVWGSSGSATRKGEPYAAAVLLLTARIYRLRFAGCPGRC